MSPFLLPIASTIQPVGDPCQKLYLYWHYYCTSAKELMYHNIILSDLTKTFVLFVVLWYKVIYIHTYIDLSINHKTNQIFYPFSGSKIF